jgi:uncharacterized protein YuzE
MKVRYFSDTDTMLIEFRDEPVAETRELDESTILDLDAKDNIRSSTLQRVRTHRTFRTNRLLPEFALALEMRRARHILSCNQSTCAFCTGRG